MSFKGFEVSHSRRRIVVGLFIFRESYISLNNHNTDELLLKIVGVFDHSKLYAIFMKPEDTKPCYKTALI